MPLALFDLDETLICADSDHLWGEFLQDKGLVDDRFTRQSQAFYDDYTAGTLDVTAYLEFAASVLATNDVDALNQWREEFVSTVITPVIAPGATALLDKHRDKGDTLVIITSTIEFVTAPIAKLLGVETLIAPVPEMVGGRYTGKMTGTPSFREGKVTRLKQWLADKPLNLEGSHFYSDSFNDLPLLRTVDFPVAVDPDETLKAEAMAQKWPVITLRD